MKVKCHVCGKEFKPLFIGQKFCCIQCQEEKATETFGLMLDFILAKAGGDKK